MGYEVIVEVKKFNPYHDRLGRFTTAGSAASVTFKPGASRAHDLSIQRMKEKNSALTPVDKPVHLSATYRAPRNTSSRAGYRTQSVIEAKQSKIGSGILELSYAEPTKTTWHKNGNADYEYELSHGLYQRSNRSGISDSIGIDWDKVHTVKGKTYESQDFLKDKGFKWDAENKFYTKNPINPPKAKLNNGHLEIPKGGSLPDDLTGVTRISGNTYANKDKIKAAGFKWNPSSKEWVKPGVVKSVNMILLDDEPCLTDYITEIG